MNRRVIFAVDPGLKCSGYCVMNPENCDLLEFGWLENQEVLAKLDQYVSSLGGWVAYEKVQSYGNLIGRDVLETTEFCGEIRGFCGGRPTLKGTSVYGVPRKTVLAKLLRNPNAGKPNCRRFVLDYYYAIAEDRGFRVASKGREPIIGVWNDRGYLYGVNVHSVDAILLALYVRDYEVNTVLVGS